MADQISLYGISLDTQGLSEIWPALKGGFATGYLIAELYSGNLREHVKALKGTEMEDLVSCRFFDGAKQLKCRRIRDDLFWAVADFQPGSWKKIPKGEECQIRKRTILLWGYANKDLGFVYEDRIPILFQAPDDFDDRDRLAVVVEEYFDSRGNTIWDKFLTFKKWDGSDG